MMNKKRELKTLLKKNILNFVLLAVILFSVGVIAGDIIAQKLVRWMEN